MLGIYEDTAQLDHDVDMRLEELIASMSVGRAVVIASIKRQMKGRS